MAAQLEPVEENSIPAAILEKLDSLSPERQRELLDFAEFLVQRETHSPSE